MELGQPGSQSWPSHLSPGLEKTGFLLGASVFSSVKWEAILPPWVAAWARNMLNTQPGQVHTVDTQDRWSHG